MQEQDMENGGVQIGDTPLDDIANTVPTGTSLRQSTNQVGYLRKKWKDLSDQEIMKNIKDLELKRQLSYWRVHCLKVYRDSKLGNF